MQTYANAAKSVLHSHTPSSVTLESDRSSSGLNLSNAISPLHYISCFCVKAANYRTVWTGTQIAKPANRIGMIEVFNKICEQFFRQQPIGLFLNRSKNIKSS